MSAPKISEAEWQVMETLWSNHPATAIEVVTRLVKTGWSEATVKTMLGRLVKKGAVLYQPDGKRYLYSPAVARDELVQEESASFVERVFDGDASAFVTHFVRSGSLSHKEVAALRRLLDEGAH